MLVLIAATLHPAWPALADAPAGAPPADPHQHLQQILQRPLYQRWQLRQQREQQPESSLMASLRQQAQDFGRWLRDLIDWLFSGKRRSGRSGSSSWAGGLVTLFQAVAWIALGLFVIALVILVVRLIRSRSLQGPTAAVLSREQVAEALSQGAALALRGDQWLDEAGRLASENDFRAMYRALYLGLLSGLHANGKIVFDRHHTNWTYVNRYRGEASEREVFSSLTDLFDSVWYGFKASRGEDIQSLRRRVESLTRPTPARGDQRAA
jgi:hypothetical protein